VAIIGYGRVSTTHQNRQLQLDALRDAGAARVFTDHGVSASTASRPELDACLDHLRAGDILIMAAFAQLGRDTMIERTRAGLAAAAANGRKGGRPRKVDDADAAKARSLRDKGITASDIAKMLGVSRATVYRYLSDGASLTA
jgi:DNA invertase Pin-like site-specific DNA recombinase